MVGLNLPARYPAGSPLHPSSLKSKQRDLRDGFPTALTLRVHRALSWLTRAEQEHDDLDVRFLLLWIGFNAAYLLDITRQIEGDTASLAMADAASPTVLRETADDSALFVLMPMRV